MKNTHIHLGPPGTGKTTKLLNIVDELLTKEGILPNEICFITFTKKAAHEATTRACEKFKLTVDDLCFFKTLHSLCFRQLALERKQIMGFANYIDIARLLGISISGRGQSDDGTFAGFEHGDRLLFTENLARVRCIDLQTAWEEFPDEDLNYAELVQLRDTLAEYKRINLKMDFTDMVHKYVAEGTVPHIKVLIVDEAQDLSQIQWRMVSKLSDHAEITHIAGDDDQAIYRWAGADVDHWINLTGQSISVLDRSFRVPKRIADLAATVIERCENRRAKVWKPREALGHVHYLPVLEMLDMKEGNWLCLARNTYLTRKFEEFCTMQGFLYTSQGGDALRGPAWKAVITWERLRAGKEQPFVDVANMYDFLSIRERIKYGAKGKLGVIAKQNPNVMVSMDTLKADHGLLVSTIWHEALDKLSIEDREFFLAALRNGEKVNQEPRIKISTIHAAKGGEADNVVVITDMAMRTHLEMLANPDDESRVWYVAVTRAKENLYIIQPQTLRHYDL